MYQVPEQLAAFNKASIEAAARIAGVALDGAERLMELQLRAAKEAIADSAQGAKQLAAVKDLQELAALKDTLAQPTIEKATAYARDVYDIASATQAELGKILEQQVVQFNREVAASLERMAKAAPAGSEAGIAALKSAVTAINASYDNMSKVAKQLVEVSQSNFDAVARQAANGAKKKAKKG